MGIERAVIVNATPHGRDNRVVTDAIAESGGRYKGIANVDATLAPVRSLYSRREAAAASRSSPGSAAGRI